MRFSRRFFVSLLNLGLVLILHPFIKLRKLRHKEGNLPEVPKPISDRTGIRVQASVAKSLLLTLQRVCFYLPSSVQSHRNAALLHSMRKAGKRCWDVSGMEGLGFQGLPFHGTRGSHSTSRAPVGWGVQSWGTQASVHHLEGLQERTIHATFWESDWSRSVVGFR